MIVLILIILVTAIAYYFMKINYQYWKKRKVPGPKPHFLVGNVAKSVFFIETPGKVYSDIYNNYPNEEMVGIYRGTTPTLIARDPELIKEVTVKSFGSFHDNDIEIDKKDDPLFGRNPFILKGEEWKLVRAQLTPGFTSGKMKSLYPLLEEVCENLVKFIDKHPDTTNGKGYEAKEICKRYTLNNVATCAFGLQGKCLEEENSEFRQISNDFFSHDGWTVFAFFLSMLFPSLARVLSLRIVTKKVEQKLFNIVTESLKHREENNIVRNDFLQVISQLKKTSKDYIFTDLDVTAHAAGFFGDGSETSSIVMSFTLYELAASPKVQSKLREEINAVYESNNQKLPYEALQSLPYLDAVINEGLRLHPGLLNLQKKCTQTFTYIQKNGKPVTIEKGTPIILPVFALHRDPKYFEEPDSLKPERFLEENSDKLTKYTYLPFGEGPRACIGKRFGILQIKIGIAYIIRNYELSVNKKTEEPIKYQPNNSFTTPIGGLWLDFKKINN